MIVINQEKCKGCALCTTACPKKIVVLDKNKLNKRGFHPASVTEPDKCTSCALCARMCPDVCIKVNK